MSKYPREIEPLMNNKTSLTATLEYYPIKDKTFDEDENEKPLSIHAGYSRAVLSLLDYENPNDVQAVSANISAKRGVYMLENRVKAAYEKCLAYEWSPKKIAETNTAEVDPAYTVKITGGILKGKTPAEALFEDPKKNKNLLADQYKFLRKNLEKYPKNQEQMDAITSAINKYNAGELKADIQESVQASASEFVVYEVPIKIPNADKKDGDGKTKIYSIKITCDPSQNYPFAIEIMNAQAKVVKKGNLINVDYTTAKDRVTITHRAKADDFWGFIQELANRLRQFDDIMAPHMWKKADSLSYQNAVNAKKEAEKAAANN